jgi:hypothetical protein
MSIATSADLFAHRPRCADYLRGLVTVGYHLYIPLGPRAQEAQLELSYEGQYPLEFISDATWPPEEDYTSAVRRGILEAFGERGELAIGGKFRLIRVVLDPINSCDRAFFLAAREAAASILRLLRCHADA